MCVSSALCAKTPFTFDEMMKLARIDDPKLSPDGKMVALTVQTMDMANNTKPVQVYVVSLDGGTPQRLTNDGDSNTRPRWMPDSRRLLFVSNRANGSQIWSMNLDGSDSKEITNLPTEAEGVTISPDGKLILFTSAVYPACEPANATPGVVYDPACNKMTLDRENASKMHARVYAACCTAIGRNMQATGASICSFEPSMQPIQVRDLTPGDANVPPFSLGGPERSRFRLTPAGHLCRGHRSGSGEQHQLGSVHGRR